MHKQSRGTIFNFIVALGLTKGKSKLTFKSIVTSCKRKPLTTAEKCVIFVEIEIGFCDNFF